MKEKDLAEECYKIKQCLGIKCPYHDACVKFIIYKLPRRLPNYPACYTNNGVYNGNEPESEW